MALKDIFLQFQQIESTPKRLEMRALLATLLGSLTPESAAIVSYILLGRIVPKFVAVEFQVSDKTLLKVVSKIIRKTEEETKKELSVRGDLGNVLEAFKDSKTHSAKEPSLEELYASLWEIAGTVGTGSQLAKQQKIEALLHSLTPISAKYVIRILNGKLRLGSSDRTILDAMASQTDDVKKYAEIMRKAAGYVSDIGHVVYLFKKFGKDLESLTLFTPGVPIFPRLVERESTIEAIFKRIPNPYIEPKYDGLRLQVHIFDKSSIQKEASDRVWFSYLQKNVGAQAQMISTEGKFEVKLFSRELEDMTNMFPEILEAAQKLPEQYKKATGKKISTLVLDGEVIGYNSVVEEFLTYQQTMTRRRKHNIAEAQGSVPVKVFVFDVLQVGEQETMSLPLDERKRILGFLDQKGIQSIFVKTEYEIVTDVRRAEEIFQKYIAEGLEGVIFKDGKTIYEPDTRNFDWIKFKRAMKKELADTVDLVLLGYYYGEGRLAKHGIGALLSGIYDRENDQFLTVTKIGTGITDELWTIIKQKCDEVVIDHKQARVNVPNALIPDVWLDPQLVVETEADEITKSPLHTSGYALRFPRFIRFREKGPEEATTLEELKRLATL